MKKLFIFLLFGAVAAGLSSCLKGRDPFANGSYHTDPNDPYGEYSFQPITYDVGEMECYVPGTLDLGINTRTDGTWNQRCTLRLVITSNTSGYVNGVWTNTSTGSIVYGVEKPGLVTSFGNKEHYYNAGNSGTQTVSFVAYKYGSTTRFAFVGWLKFFECTDPVDFSAFSGLYNSQSQSVSKNGLVYNVLSFTKQISGYGTCFDRPFRVEYDYRRP